MYTINCYTSLLLINNLGACHLALLLTGFMCIICKKVAYWGTNIVGPYQMPCIMLSVWSGPTIFAHKNICCSLCSASHKYYHKPVNTADLRWHCFFPNKPSFHRWRLIHSRISISRTWISRILRNSKRLSESKIHFDCFLQQSFGVGDFFTSQNYPKYKFICTSGNLNL